MDLQGFREYLVTRGVTEDKLDGNLNITQEFIDFLTDGGKTEIAKDANREVIEIFAKQLAATGRDSDENFLTLARFSKWLDHRPLFVGWLEVLECSDTLQVLAEKIEARHGKSIRELIFQEKSFSLSATQQERWNCTSCLLDRMAEHLSTEESQQIWYETRHGLPPEFWQKDDAEQKEKFRQCNGDIDAFLALRRKDRDEMLTRLHDTNTLLYTIEITDEVLAFLTSDPEIMAGRRDGDKIYFTKIPYDPGKYLHATDPNLKRYYACHCTLMREGIRQGKVIQGDLCHCAMGYESHALAGLDREVKGEVLESAAKGDLRCRFVFTIQ